MNYQHIIPGTLEVYCGPMKSGKTKELLHKVDTLKYIQNCEVLFIKPKMDTRDSTIKSRFGNEKIQCHFINEKNPKEILDIFSVKYDLLIIDEIQFFSKKIIKIIEIMLKKGMYVIVAGLDTDFRGEGFGPIPQLMTLASKVHKLSGICEYKHCNNSSIRTQKLINGKPAKLSENIIGIEGEEHTYETRCLIHHFIKE